MGFRMCARAALLGCAVAALMAGPWTAALAQPADLIFRGGNIVTVADGNRLVEAVAVEQGRIVAVGSLESVLRRRGPETREVELGDGALLPGFIDAHGHLVGVAQLIDLANVSSPPVGEVTNIADLLEVLQRYAQERGVESGDLIVGSGYDDSLLAEKRHPTKFDLDSAFPDNPVALRHVSGHLATVSSRTLELIGYDASTPDPPGGVIRRVASSREANGVLEESAFGPAFGLLEPPSLEVQLEQLDRAQHQYASYGLTTAQDGYTSGPGLALLQQAAERGRLFIDVVTYPTGRDLAAAQLDRLTFGEYHDRLKIGGVKLMLDGSPQGKTAFLTEPYLVPPDGKEKGYRGYPAMPQEQVDELFHRYLSRSVHVIAHANGDAAADQLIHALTQVRNALSIEDHRTVMIHSQFVREDQLDRLKELEVIPSFFAAHSFYWGDWHRDSVFGVERAYRLSAAKSALARDIPFTFHNDAPVVPPDVMRLVWAGVNRRTRSGDILGPQQRIEVTEAIRAVTINAAFQNHEEDEKGSIEVGKVADLVVLSANPLEVDSLAIKDIVVVETFSRGRSIYRRGGGS